MTLPIKRVVTGVDDSGTSIAYEDALLPPVELALMPGVQMFQVWGTEGPLSSPLSDPKPDNATFFPGPGGTRFGLFRLPPDPAGAEAAGSHTGTESAAADIDEQVAEAETKVPGLISVFEPDAPGMHQTVTIDYIVVLEGDLAVELDNGVEVSLPPGTCLVQNGARHGWRNRGTGPATLAYVIVDATPTA